uniref:C2H2-type domain-containing protein n=1 Tax=Macrostomum lignano TaxID=282301 RepID=A0A1I8FS13_9PLAT
LIPKTEKPSDPGEFRPLAIASVFGRVFHRILASRLGVWAPLGASQRAFQVNPAKCSTLAIIWDGKNKRWLHDAKGQFKFRGSTLPALGVEESYKYLGLQYGSKGKLKTGLELLKGMLRELKEAPLKPQQRVFLLRTNILPKIMYYLVNGRVHQYTLRECDKCVRRFLREVLHLPHDTPVSAFHACAKDGGLDIDCFESLVPMYKWQKLVSLEEVPDNLVRDLSQLPAIRKRFQLKGAQTSFNNRAEYRMFWKNKLLDNLDGFGLGEAADVPQVHSWVTDGSSLLTGEIDQELSNGALATKEGRVCTPAFCTSTSAPGKINATKSSPEDDSRRCREPQLAPQRLRPVALESVTIWCCKCNAFNRANLKGVVSHWGSCKGPVAVVAPGAGTSSTADSDPGDAAPHVCKFCERAFTTATGLGLHVQKSHKDEHNKALPTKKIFKYEDAEVKDLARAELTLRTKGRVNIELQKMFPHRTVQSIANLRKSEKYRSFLDEARSELEQTPSVASTTDDEVSTLPETVAEEEHQEMAEEPADAEELILEGIKAAINFFVSKYEFGPDSLKREVARYLKEGLVDSDCWSELEPLLKDAWFIKEEHGQKKAKRKPKSKSLPRLKRTGRAFHRREKYAICQKSLDKDFSGTISKILDGVEISEAEVRPEMAKIEEVYQQRLGNTSGALPENTDTPVVEGLRFERKTAPFDAQEVTRAIRESNKSTAAGPDRWFNGRCLKNLDCETVAALFNLWRFKQKIPSALRENRTILLPKGGDLTDANNWRPLTIGSLLLRLYAKSLTTRWSDAPICERQKAFRPVDGCWENINLLLGALKSAHKKRRQINLISIDLAKAFDNIQHGAIFNAMRRFGFSPTTDYETKRMVEITEKFFARQMLAVNLKKCKALRLLPVKGKRTLKVSSDPMLWKGEQLPMVKSIDDFISYLGVKVSVTGKVIWSVDQLRLWLDRVMKAPLKPDQKIKGIKEVLIGRLTYQLRLSEARVCELRRVTRMTPASDMVWPGRRACGARSLWARMLASLAAPMLALDNQYSNAKRPVRKKAVKRELKNREKRRRAYGEMQRIYSKDRKKAAAAVFSGAWRLWSEPREENKQFEDQKMEYWKRVLGRESDPDGRPVKPLREPAVEIEEPISLAECKKALRDLKQTASGPDGVSWSSVKSLGPGWLQYLFNSILACGYPTKSFKNSRTVLIPKTEKPSDPGEFRPLAIASVFGRVFHRILASRLGVWAPLGASQRAFQYGSKGKLKTGLELLKGMLRELKEAPLKPQQRVFLLRTNILPKIMYYLVNGRVHQYTLRECDKEVLHLPHDTPVSAFHACAKDGGLDIDCFESLVPMYKWQKLVSLEEVPDNLVRDLSQLPAIRKRFQLKGAQTSF